MFKMTNTDLLQLMTWALWLLELSSLNTLPVKLPGDYKGISAAANRRLPQAAVTWLIEGLCFYPSLVPVESLVLLNRQMWQAAKR